MSRLTVALLSGGVSPERSISLAGGQAIDQALDKKKYHVLYYDPQNDLARLAQEAYKIDIAFVLLHGVYGEDGTIQGFLDLLGIPYQCSGVLGSALSVNKLAAKKIYEQEGLSVPPYRVLHAPDRQPDPREIEEAVASLGWPLVIKPACGGSSIGMSIVQSPRALPAAVELALQHDTTVLLETYINGRELTGGVLGNAHPEALPVIEIIPESRYPFFDYEAKYTAGATREICPAPIEAELTRKVQDYARRAHIALFCKGCSRTDMIVRGAELFVLETNTIPGMVPTSLLPLAARTAGISFDQLVDQLIQFGLETSAHNRSAKGLSQ